MLLQFFKCITDKLFSLMSSEKSENANKETKEIIGNTTEAFTTCQRHSMNSQPFHVRIPEKQCLIRKYLLILYFWTNYLYDSQLIFKLTSDLPSLFVVEHLNIFGKHLYNAGHAISTGYPDKLRLHQGNKYDSTFWLEMSSITKIEVVKSSDDSHNSIRAGEHYHGPLQTIY